MFESTIQWNFDKFQPNTIWKASKALKNQLISKDQMEKQKSQMIKLILITFVEKINPFSLISFTHNFMIMDKKKKKRNAKKKFNFSKDSGFQGPKDFQPENIAHNDGNDQASMLEFVNQLHKYLVDRWAQCDQIMDSIPYVDNPLSDTLSEYLNDLSKQDLQAKVLLVGNNPMSVQNIDKQQLNQLHFFFAIKYQDQSTKLKQQIILQNNIQIFLSSQHQISKFILFNKEKKFYQLEVKLSFDKKQNFSKESNIKCRITVIDEGKFFQYVINGLSNQKKLFKDFSFKAHGDYIEHPFKESIARKRKFMKQKSYSLVFQGGGAKGAAYVGAYKAIKEMKKGGKTVPITSIMGSSAGGIIALAVSTGIEPYEVQKICNKMETIPKIDKIDRGYLRTLKKYSQNEANIDDKIKDKQQLMKNKIIQILNEYGVIQKNVSEKLLKYIESLDQQQLNCVWKLLIKWLRAKSESIGQIFDISEGDLFEFNFLGLLLEGAMMTGQAIHNIGSECLVKYVLSKNLQSSEQDFENSLGVDLLKKLKQSIKEFNELCSAVLSIRANKFSSQDRNRVLISIINKIFMIIDRNLKRLFEGKQKFILNENFATTLLQYFDYTPCYDNKPYPEEAKDALKECPHLYNIVFNHHKLHPNSTDMGITDSSQKQEKLKRVTSFLNDQNNKHEIPHQILSQIIGEEYFLDPRNFTLKQKYYHLSLGDLLRGIFTHIHVIEHQGENHGNQNCIFDDQLFKRDLTQIITETLNQKHIFQDIEQLTKYNNCFDAFKKSVQEITLQKFYNMTKIELTCTSVDLDNKILRFFNQKTTPDLPVCRAVQMTGSFPVAFKALPWQQSWGRYLIHYEDHCRQVILNGHEFTDGGMLANFPIKYFDNDNIRDTYFSHVVNRSRPNEVKNPYQTIMLGFGLDKLANEQYTPSENEFEIRQKKLRQQNDAFENLKNGLLTLVGYTGKFPTVKAAIKGHNILISNIIADIKSIFKSQNPNQIQWNHLNRNLINDIPILRFGFKLLQAYPNADRNLNLECFKDKVYRTELLLTEKTIKQKTYMNIIEIHQYIRSLKGDIFQPEKSFLNRWKNTIKELFTGNIQRVDNLKKTIENAINLTPIKNIFFGNIHQKFKLMAQMQAKATLSDEEMMKKKIKIKHILFRIISNRMKLDLSKNDIEWHILEFVSLKFRNIFIQKKNFIEQWHNHKDQYKKNKQDIPIQKYQGKIIKSSAVINSKFDIQNEDEQDLMQLYNKKIKNEDKILKKRKDYIFNNLSEKEVQKFQKVQSCFLANQDKYLTQYIFLLKIKDDDLVNANQMLKKISVKLLLRCFNKKRQEYKDKQIKQRQRQEKKVNNQQYYAYITINDLKTFYRKTFSAYKDPQAQRKYDPITLLEVQSLHDYQYQKGLQHNQNDVIYIQPKKFNSSTYLEQKIKVNSIVSQALLLQRSYVEKIEFGNFLREVYSNNDAIQKIRAQILKFISLNQDKYNKILAEILYPNQRKLFKGNQFKSLLNNKDIAPHILHILFNKDDQYYSNNQRLSSIYEELFQQFKKDKDNKLKEINEQIKDQYDKQDFQYNPINFQIQFLQHLQEKINYLLLISRIEKAKKIDYDLRDADLNTGTGIQSDRIQRQVIRDEINKQQGQKAKICVQMVEKIKLYQSNFHILERLLNHIRFVLHEFNHLIKDSLVDQIIKIVNHQLIKIKQQIIERLNNVINIPIGSIKMIHIEDVYTLEYSGVKQILKSIFTMAKMVHQCQNKIKHQCQQRIRRNQLISQTENQKQEKIKSLTTTIASIFRYFDQIEFKLPHFQIVRSIYKKQFQSQQYSNSLLEGLNKQFTNTFIRRCSQVRSKNNLNTLSDLKIHLILEGSDLSNYYYAYYYELFDDFRKKLQKDYQKSDVQIPYQIQKSAHLMKVRAITTSSFHSIFGFLIALNYTSSQLKHQMARIRDIAHQFELKKLMQGYFESYQWSKISTQQQKEFWTYIRQEKYHLFKELEKVVNNSLPNHNLIQSFNEIRSFYEHQQDKVMKYCEDILHDISLQMNKMKDANPQFIALEISKKYAYNYTCDLKKQHQYTYINETSHKLYEQIIKKLFTAYGSLLEGIVTNIYSAQIQFKLTTTQPGIISKGFIVKQLLTTFKIKEYVIGKLKQNNLRQNITLSQFFNNAPYKILLSFTTINVHKARLEFMNKNTLPNMPIWAAIVSASCLPYFYKDFECPRQWQHTASDTASLYDIFVNNFFKSNIISYKHAKYISGNIISSLPLQLLTTETILTKMFTYIYQGEPYLHIGYAFDAKDNEYKNSEHKLNRPYLDFGIFDIIKLFCSLNPQNKFNENCNGKHINGNYNQSSFSSLPDKFKKIIGMTHLAKYITILAESNDNYMLHTYWDRLIRLPIKFDTLDFHQITNSFIKDTYGVNVASDKAKHTMERSYEITKYFERKHFAADDQTRYEMNIRVSIILHQQKNDEEKVYYAKIDLLSHSKWNRNRYNNFLVYYSNNPLKFDQNKKIAMESEILWNINDSSEVYLRFYFPKYAKQQIQQVHIQEKQKRDQNKTKKNNTLKSQEINQNKQSRNRQASKYISSLPNLNSIERQKQESYLSTDSLKIESKLQEQMIRKISKANNTKNKYQNLIKDSIIYSSIVYTQLELNLINIIRELPLQNSYDYTINFYQPLPQGETYDKQTGIKISKYNKVKPIKQNSSTTNKETPELKVKSWSNQGKQGEQSYIQPLLQ